MRYNRYNRVIHSINNTEDMEGLIWFTTTEVAHTFKWRKYNWRTLRCLRVTVTHVVNKWSCENNYCEAYAMSTVFLSQIHTFYTNWPTLKLSIAQIQTMVIWLDDLSFFMAASFHCSLNSATQRQSGFDVHDRNQSLDIPFDFIHQPQDIIKSYQKTQYKAFCSVSKIIKPSLPELHLPFGYYACGNYAEKKGMRPGVRESGKGSPRLIKLLSRTNSRSPGRRAGPSRALNRSDPPAAGQTNASIEMKSRQKGRKKSWGIAHWYFFCVYRPTPLASAIKDWDRPTSFGIDMFAHLVGQCFCGPGGDLAVISNW